MIDVSTLQSWIEQIHFEVTPVDATMLRIRPLTSASRDDEELPPFFVQCTENWILFTILPMLEPEAPRDAALGRRLLAMNRDMRLAKFAVDRTGAVVLCAELPTESLDASEVADAAKRMVKYARRFHAEIRHRERVL